MMVVKPESKFNKIKIWLCECFGWFSLTEYEKLLLEELKRHLTPEFSEILDSQLKEFNQTARLIKPYRGENPVFGETSFYKNKWGKSLRNFKLMFPTNKDSQTLATLDVIEPDNKIRVEFVLVMGRFFCIEYRSKIHRYVPKGEFTIENFKLYDL